MFNFYSLSSSSSGNCYLIETNETKILVDVGITVKKINTELEKINLSLDNIDALFITHEHSDHCKSLNNIAKLYNIPIFINKPTLNALKDKNNIEQVNYIKSNEEYIFHDLHIKPFDIPHDAAQPFGYTFKKGSKKISIATDMGTISQEALKALSNNNFALIESNYDINMLNAGKYPYYIKKRIASNYGHLSNNQCSEMIAQLIQKNTTNFMLGHLSVNNNFPELAMETIKSELITNKINLKDIQLSVASNNCLSNNIIIEK